MLIESVMLDRLASVKNCGSNRAALNGEVCLVEDVGVYCKCGGIMW